MNIYVCILNKKKIESILKFFFFFFIITFLLHVFTCITCTCIYILILTIRDGKNKNYLTTKIQLKFRCK